MNIEQRITILEKKIGIRENWDEDDEDDGGFEVVGDDGETTEYKSPGRGFQMCYSKKTFN